MGRWLAAVRVTVGRELNEPDSQWERPSDSRREKLKKIEERPNREWRTQTPTVGRRQFQVPFWTPISANFLTLCHHLRGEQTQTNTYPYQLFCRVRWPSLHLSKYLAILCYTILYNPTCCYAFDILWHAKDSYFGEYGVLFNQPREATARCEALQSYTFDTCDARPIDLKMCQNKHPVSIWCCKALLVECFRKRECNLWMPLAALKTKEADRNLLLNHARILYALVVFNFIQVVRSLLLDLPLSTPWPGLRDRIVWASHWTIRNPGNNLRDSKMSLSH